MSEIIYVFRGIAINPFDGWLYGSLLVIKDRITEKTEFYIQTDNSRVSVTPESIGQFIGMKDVDGKRMFDMDIVSTNKGANCIIEFINGGFRLRQVGFNYTYTPHCTSPEDILKYDIKVIGNKLDNPELLTH